MSFIERVFENFLEISTYFENEYSISLKVSKSDSKNTLTVSLAKKKHIFYVFTNKTDLPKIKEKHTWVLSNLEKGINKKYKNFWVFQEIDFFHADPVRISKIISNHPLYKVFIEKNHTSLEEQVFLNLKKITDESIQSLAQETKLKMQLPMIINSNSQFISTLNNYDIEIKYVEMDPDVKAWGYVVLKERQICINTNYKNTREEIFTLAHELGHIELHSDLEKIPGKTRYDFLKLSEARIDNKTGKKILENQKNWIEHQAIVFAYSFLFDKKELQKELCIFQNKQGLSKAHQGYIYWDKGKHANALQQSTLQYLAEKMNLPVSVVFVGLKKFGLVKQK